MKSTGFGNEAFEEYYQSIFGERWEGLRAALLKEPRQTSLQAKLIKPYFLDEASVVAAGYLNAQSTDRVLDCCAAPGGKSLVILSQMMNKASTDSLTVNMTANDRSASRRSRLKRVLQEHLPREISGQVAVTGHDAGRWGLHEPETCDKIMLDVPCSSERHVLASPRHLAQWSPGRIRRLAQQAYVFLLSMLSTLRSGGSIVYATCALTEAENDEVIRRVLERLHRKGNVRAVTDNRRGSEVPAWVEDSHLGFMVLPDRADGRGPMFFSRLKKL